MLMTEPLTTPINDYLGDQAFTTFIRDYSGKSRGTARAVPLDSAREEIGTSSKDPDAIRQGGDQVVDLARTSIDLR